MGEYFNNKKLGTDNHLMDVSRNHLINRIKEYPNEVNQNKDNPRSLQEYLDLSSNYIYRFPYKEELDLKWDEETKVKDLTFEVDPNKVDIPHRDRSHAEINGKVYNLPFCPHSKKAEKLDVRKINHKLVDITIFGDAYDIDNPGGYTLFMCTLCEKIFYIGKEESIYIKEVLRQMGYLHEANCINYKNSPELISKSKELTEYVKLIDRDGLEYDYQGALGLIKLMEEEDEKELTIDELKDIAFEMNFYSI
ncbi:hypothetical protein [uncultured Clostridium sp.]|uniref:hypothetical protein n=1 Tax=uncultured Clostridium sp. TaxID=59620 RepID=UPI0028EA7899|nr:hypothetical protein [uncultured Clostridium sp.]